MNEKEKEFTEEIEEPEGEYLWQDRKRLSFLGLPFTFTKYAVKKDRLMIDRGFLTRKHDEVRLYRILDVSCEETFGQRLFGLGTLTVRSSDKTLATFKLYNIKDPRMIYTLLSDAAEEQRDKKRVSAREFFGAEPEEIEDE